MKLFWRVDPKPTGKWRSFQKRQWPSATAGRDGKPLANIRQVDGDPYYPGLAEKLTLIVQVMDWRGELPVWRQLKGRPVGVTAAKELAAKFFKENPSWIGVVDEQD